MKVVKTIAAVRKLVRAARGKGQRIGFVPTMGALHAGHISLIEAARRRTDFVVVSIFVNPTQFGPSEDFKKYPRPFERDLKVCCGHGVNVVFAPAADEMYQGKNFTWVTVDELSGQLCGKFRPGHFRGVAIVCAKLFNIVMPDVAFFGQKDAQQTLVIRRMVAEMDMPLRIVVCPTIRESDGLAMSSRNRYLTAQQRRYAPLIYESLRKGRQMIERGVKEPNKITVQMRKILKRIPSAKIQYVSIVDSETLHDIDRISGKILIAVAVKIGQTRLIDNILVDAGKQ